MRELEFLPDWYPRLRQRKRRIALQGWMSLLIVAGLGLWLMLINRNTAHAQERLDQLSADLSTTQLDLDKLRSLEDLQKQLRIQDEVMARIGLHVEMTRMINALEAAMSKDMSLIDLEMEVREQEKKLTALADLVKKPSRTDTVLDRRLIVKLRGVAPTDVELANFLFKLTNESLFEAVTLNYARERRERRHLMREFEVSFAINLNQKEG